MEKQNQVQHVPAFTNTAGGRGSGFGLLASGFRCWFSILGKRGETDLLSNRIAAWITIRGSKMFGYRGSGFNFMSDGFGCMVLGFVLSVWGVGKV